jgi:hypothetical protein
MYFDLELSWVLVTLRADLVTRESREDQRVLRGKSHRDPWSPNQH